MPTEDAMRGPYVETSDCDTITSVLAAAAVPAAAVPAAAVPAAAVLPGKPSMAAGLRAWRLGVWIPDGISGKEYRQRMSALRPHVIPVQ